MRHQPESRPVTGSRHRAITQFLNDGLCFLWNDGTVQKCSVVHITELVLDGQLPVGVQHPAVGSAHELDTTGKAIKKGVEIKTHITKIGLQRLYLQIKTAKNQSSPGFNPGDRLQAKGRLVWSVGHLALLGNSHQAAIHGIGPVVIWANKPLGITVVGPAHRQATVGTAVDVGVKLEVFSPRQNHRGFTHVGLHEVTGDRNL